MFLKSTIFKTSIKYYIIWWNFLQQDIFKIIIIFFFFKYRSETFQTVKFFFSSKILIYFIMILYIIYLLKFVKIKMLQYFVFPVNYYVLVSISSNRSNKHYIAKWNKKVVEILTPKITFHFQLNFVGLTGHIQESLGVYMYIICIYIYIYIIVMNLKLVCYMRILKYVEYENEKSLYFQSYILFFNFGCRYVVYI